MRAKCLTKSTTKTTIMKKLRAFASITAILRTNRKNKYGEYPVCIRITKNRKVCLLSTPYSSPKKCWDNKIQRPNGKHYDFDELDKYLDGTISEFKKIMKELSDTVDYYSAKQVVDIYSVRNQPSVKTSTQPQITFKEFYEKLLNRMESKGHYKTKETYVTAVAWLNKFRKIEDVNFKDVTFTFLEDLLAFMVKTKESENQISFKPNTLFGYFKNYLAIMNKAVAERIITASCSNYKEFKLSQFKIAVNPIAIPIEQMNEIIALKLEPFTSIWNSRNYFVFSFLGSGINLVDIAKLKKENLRDGRIEYSRSKTEECCKFKLNVKTQEILKYYVGQTYGDFLFPILLKDYTKKQHHGRIKTISRKVNQDLKEIARVCGIETNLTFYVGRHTCATELKYLGFNDSAIGEGFGHVSERSIKSYLRRLPDQRIDSLNDVLYKKVLAQKRIVDSRRKSVRKLKRPPVKSK